MNWAMRKNFSCHVEKMLQNKNIIVPAWTKVAEGKHKRVYSLVVVEGVHAMLLYRKMFEAG